MLRIQDLKVYHYVSIGISLIFMVMGILIFTSVFDTHTYFANNTFIRYMFGSILLIYGVFRAYNSYLKITAKQRNYHYWKKDEEEE